MTGQADAMNQMLSTIEINDIKTTTRIATVYDNLETKKLQLRRNIQKVGRERSQTCEKRRNAHKTKYDK
jgi:hypothetical protein